MNQVQMITLLNTLTDIPSFYDHAPVGTVLPFATIHCTEPDNFAADNRVYCEKWLFRFDLYTVNKDLTLESEIKALLNDNGIPWVRTEEYLDDQSCWEVEFEFETLGNEDSVEPDPPDPPTPPDPPEEPEPTEEVIDDVGT